MIKVTERFVNFVDPGDDYEYWAGEFETLFEVFECELVNRWLEKLDGRFNRMAINLYRDPTGVFINGNYMLTIYSKDGRVYNIATIE